MIRYDLRGFGRSGAPTGELDTSDFRQITALIGREIPQARVMIVPGAGHMVNMETPEQVTQALLEFLEVR